MQFGILGPLEVRGAGGEVIPVGGPRPRALLVMLLLGAGRVVDVAELIDGQYGEDPPAGAANAVQAHVSRLRRGLGAELIEFRGSGYRLAVDPDDVDAHRFERLAGQGRRLLAAGHHDLAAAALREALGLWRGPALPDLPFGRASAARLAELRLTAGEDLAEAELALPEGASVAELQRLVAAHPLRERFRAQLMRALQAAGRQAEALAAFEEGRRLLAGELGADPSPELAAAHLAVLRADAPAPAPRRRLPARLTSFVGRERELDLIAALSGSRLLTVVGPGGIGKTRLAIEAATRDRRDAYFADLSSLTAETAPSPAGHPPTEDGASAFTARSSFPAGMGQVARAVLGALGLRESGLQPPQASDPVLRLVSALAEQDVLLLLDNSEHVITSAAKLVRVLLDECPSLHVLATSREPLGITGEALVTLTPLDTPRLGATASDVPSAGGRLPGDPLSDVPAAGIRAVEALRYPAVRLFADRAAAVRPAFEVRQDNVDAVVRICAALDGLPLAVELAAARLRSFGVEEIAARLAEDGRFRLLSRGDRTAAARHRALRAVVEWSWDLLSADEQALARRFSAFAGGASVAAAEAVCGLEDAAGVLADLVDKSLIGVDGDRYRMLETIRLFCAERLAEAGEEAGVRRRHARWCAELAREADPHLRRGEQLEWLARLSAENGNLMGAMRWAVRHDRETALRMVATLATYWWLSGRQRQAGEVAAELLEAIGGPARGLEEEYVMCVLHAVPPASPEHWARAEAYMRGLDRPLRHPFTAALWGMTAGPPDAPLGPERDWILGSDPWSLALGRLGRALLRLLDGEPAVAERELEEVLARFRALGERWGIAQGLDWLAVIAGWRGEWGRCRVLWQEALRLLDELGALEEAADVLARRGDALVREGDLVAASADYRRAEELARRAGRPEAPVMAGLGLGEIAGLEGDLAEARRRLETALIASESGGFADQQALARVLTALARLSGGEAGDGRGGISGRRLHHALALYRRAFTAAHRSPLASGLADAAEGQAAAIVAEAAAPAAGADRDAGRRAALLLGVAVVLRGIAVAGDPHVARTAATAERLVGAQEFAAEFARGAGMGRGEALTVLDRARAWVSAGSG
ncbi:BTAD domain-containing putative transcriptional regulator [Nonomuraea sp. LPB2021202275-12-8]|uniref:BTAD domain-containing putative transcriptional regulator n=1 Tax=Nonomuraea sp. LPB2021202275-12-8 TaxID=3120159 RepID=UPI00300C2E72